MGDWRVRTGVALGLAAAAVFTVALGGGRGAPPGAPRPLPAHGPVLSDCDGSIRELVIQYVPEAAAVVERAYREFLRQLPADVVVYAVCPDRDAFDELKARAGPIACSLRPVLAGHPMTCWSRDRWLALAPARGGLALLLSPREEDGAGIWPRRAGDQRIGDDLAAALPGRVVSVRSPLVFDGGDFVADDSTVFVTPQVARRNVGTAVNSEDELRRALAAVLQRTVVLLPESPEYHAGMFMMLAAGRTAVVGDPAAANRLLGADKCLIANPDFSVETQHRFDAVAACCARSGYRVVRVPIVPDEDSRTYLTYLNVIMDSRAGSRVVYLPAYRGAEVLNDAAAGVWRGLGYEVRCVDCTETFAHFGSLRCLVNVLRRGP